MSTSTPTIPAETAAHVLFHYGREGGYQAGSFTEQLIVLIDRADPHHRDLLALGFPDYVAAIVAIQYDPNGVAQLQRIAAGEQAGLRCKRCGGVDGPFTPAGLCEPCARPVPLGGAQ